MSPSTEPAQQPERSDPSASQRTGANRQTTPDDRGPPWRVEGARQPEGATGGRPVHKRPSSWLVGLLLLLALDWILVLAYQPSSQPRITVPYSYFTQQIQASNVASVTAQASTIQGTFRHAITYPAHSGTTSSGQKSTPTT
ncbi:MAG: ATP-dependent metallopeptidase FtsH/Yme1/Tma family protein, partial [Solirubrobacteraceae bacterium]